MGRREDEIDALYDELMARARAQEDLGTNGHPFPYREAASAIKHAVYGTYVKRLSEYLVRALNLDRDSSEWDCGEALAWLDVVAFLVHQLQTEIA